MDALQLKALITQEITSYTIGYVLDLFIDNVSQEIKNLDRKVSRILSEPYETALRRLSLAKQYSENSHEQHRELEKAQDMFDKAASYADGYDKVTSLIFASKCCALRQDETGERFYCSSALPHLRKALKQEAAKVRFIKALYMSDDDLRLYRFYCKKKRKVLRLGKTEKPQ